MDMTLFSESLSLEGGGGGIFLELQKVQLTGGLQYLTNLPRQNSIQRADSIISCIFSSFMKYSYNGPCSGLKFRFGRRGVGGGWLLNKVSYAREAQTFTL